MRKYTLGRWNWSQKAGKWVYVDKKETGKRKYLYQEDTPKSFLSLTMKLKKINDKLMATEDPDEKNELFTQMIKVSNKMQNMHKQSSI